MQTKNQQETGTERLVLSRALIRSRFLEWMVLRYYFPDALLNGYAPIGWHIGELRYSPTGPGDIDSRDLRRVAQSKMQSRIMRRLVTHSSLYFVSLLNTMSHNLYFGANAATV